MKCVENNELTIIQVLVPPIQKLVCITALDMLAKIGIKKIIDYKNVFGIKCCHEHVCKSSIKDTNATLPATLTHNQWYFLNLTTD